MKPGEVITKNEKIDLNKDSKVTKIKNSAPKAVGIPLAVLLAPRFGRAYAEAKTKSPPLSPLNSSG